LPAALNDPDLGVRATILNALRGRARAPDAAVAFAAWRRAARDPESDAGVAALRVIAVAWRTDSASFSSELRDSLSAAQPSADPAERNVGRAIGALRHWPVPVTVPKPVEWYADKVRTIVASDLVGRPITATIATTRGAVRIRFFGADAPLTVANFVQLVRRRYYDGSLFHRVVPNFVAQDGDPRGDGSGGPGYAIRDELNRRWYDRGAVGMALSGPDTGGSQYFLTHSPQPHLDGHYTVFGHVIAGLDVLDAIVQGDRIVTITVH
jgi:cyclophilin family peptidyl-prolyl cis-trans isomerase